MENKFKAIKEYLDSLGTRKLLKYVKSKMLVSVRLDNNEFISIKSYITKEDSVSVTYMVVMEDNNLEEVSDEEYDKYYSDEVDTVEIKYKDIIKRSPIISDMRVSKIKMLSKEKDF